MELLAAAGRPGWASQSTATGSAQSTGASQPPSWVEHLVVPAMLVGTYGIVAGGVDDQTPHDENELYVVTAGRARITSGGRTLDVSPGDVLYVPAGEAHHFHDVDEDLTLLVVFAPGEGGG